MAAPHAHDSAARIFLPKHGFDEQQARGMNVAVYALGAGPKRGCRTVMLLVLFTTSCLALPNGEVPPEASNHAPVLVPGQDSPRGFLVDIDPRCRCFRVGLEVTDADEEPLRVRFSTGMGPGVRLARCEDKVIDQGVIDFSVFMQQFSVDGTEPRDGDFGTMTVSVTDAAAFRIRDRDATTIEECGAIDTEVDPDRIVIHRDWALRFADGITLTCDDGC